MPGGAASAGTSAGWLWDALGLRVRVDEDAYGAGLSGLAGLALRRNPRRAHLLVSTVLGKHLPVVPGIALDAGHRLAARVPALGAPPLVLGYCETATSLGHVVADHLAHLHSGSRYLHTTRRGVPGIDPPLGFEEAHSHATQHWVLPEDPAQLRDGCPVVLVDDELSTGATALGTIRALHRYAPHASYTVAALLDMRPRRDRAAFAALADELGVPVRVVSLLSGELAVPPDVAERAARVRATSGQTPAPPALSPPAAPRAGDAARHPVRTVVPDWPGALPDGARHGWDGHDSAALDAALPALADAVASAGMLPAGGRTLVLGSEELMYVPLRLAAALSGRAGDAGGAGEAGGGRSVVYHSTTRSPVHPLDRDGYAVRAALTFPAPDEPGRVSHVYNVRPGMYDAIVLVVDGGEPAGAAEALRGCAPVTVVSVPSYRPGRADPRPHRSRAGV